MQISINIQGLDKARKLIQDMPGRATKEIGQAVEKSLYTVEGNAKKEAPVNKQSGGGNLRQSINTKITSKGSGEVNVDAKYAVMVHEGTRPHTITVNKKRVLADRRNDIIFGKTVQHPGTKPNPFLRRAVEKSEGKIQGFFQQAISAIIKTS